MRHRFSITLGRSQIGIQQSRVVHYKDALLPLLRLNDEFRRENEVAIVFEVFGLFSCVVCDS